ncbi:hypothetical protein ABPG75_002937 [Micractinium tetrahymenae]
MASAARSALSLLLLLLTVALWGAASLYRLSTAPAFLLPANEQGQAAHEAAATAAQTASPPAVLRLANTARGRTLVLYTYGGSDPEYPENLRFFLSEAVKEGDGCEYLVILQQGEGVAPLEPLPALPPNAQYVSHPNECYDWGTWGWALETHVPDLQAYEFFIFLNPSVRGPFLPPYLRGRMHWTEPLLSKLSGSVKLVGPTISCGGVWPSPGQPHVQSYALATDCAGLAVLRSAGTVFACYEDMADVIRESELGSSRAILQAGYGIDCLMQRYQGVDWRDPATFSHGPCNGGANPLPAGHNDGIDIDPLEVLFVKVKSKMRAAGWTAVQQAVKLSEWARLADKQAARAGAGLPPSAAWLAALAASNRTVPPQALAEAQRHGQHCFDAAFYLDSSPDLGFAQRQADAAGWAWGHFTQFGLAEGRPFRYTC